VVILLKGWYFINHHDELAMIQAGKTPDVYYELIVHYVALAQPVVAHL